MKTLGMMFQISRILWGGGLGKWNPSGGNATGAPGHCNKQSCIVSEGTPDLFGRAFNHAGPLPHECGVPSQCPGTLRRNPLAAASQPCIFSQGGELIWRASGVD
jgi:hypothetical protein